MKNSHLQERNLNSELGSRNSRPVISRVLTVLLGLALCLWGIWQSSRIGLARVFSQYGLLSGQVAATDKAVALASLDAEARYARAETLERSGNSSEAAAEFERAAQLRPRDYYLWLRLGLVRDESEDQEGALRALAEAAKLAPYYAQPRWQLGNLLLRMGRLDEAFAELRCATLSDPGLLSDVIDLAWRVYSDNPQRVEDAVQPRTAHERMVLAGSFVRHGYSAAAVKQFRAAGETDRNEARQLLRDLLHSKSFSEAYELWANTHGINREPGIEIPGIYNGGFEGPLPLDDPGFGWEVTGNLSAISLSLDPSQAHSGNRSLRIEFGGDSNALVPLITQIVLVKPATSYRLSFAARTEGIVTGGLPNVLVTDAGGDSVLGQSGEFPQTTNGWQDYTTDFKSGESTRAIQIAVKRRPCSQAPCPIFGRLWLDDFSLQSVESRFQ